MSTPDFDQLRERSVAGITRFVRRRRRRLQLTAIAVGVSLAAGATGAVWTTIASEELRARSAVCYSAPSTSAPHVAIGSVDPGALKPADLAVSMCEAAWRQGFISTDGTTPPPDGVDAPVPQQFACLQPNGIVAVFPFRSDGRPTCGDLGLSEPQR